MLISVFVRVSLLSCLLPKICASKSNKTLKYYYSKKESVYPKVLPFYIRLRVKLRANNKILAEKNIIVSIDRTNKIK